jgi:hypothetical protein
MSDIKRMDIKEFLEEGFLQEVNRCFFHPLGLALEVKIDDQTGEYSLGGIWDYRSDPEGILYGEANDDGKAARIEKATKVQDLRNQKVQERLDRYGWIIQPLE